MLFNNEAKLYIYTFTFTVTSGSQLLFLLAVIDLLYTMATKNLLDPQLVEQVLCSLIFYLPR